MPTVSFSMFTLAIIFLYIYTKHHTHRLYPHTQRIMQYLRNRDIKRRCKLLTFDVTNKPTGAICLRIKLINVIVFCLNCNVYVWIFYANLWLNMTPLNLNENFYNQENNFSGILTLSLPLSHSLSFLQHCQFNTK